METATLTSSTAQCRVREYRPDFDEPQGDGQQAPDLKVEWLHHFEQATCSPERLANLAVPQREPILGDWFRQGDLGFIFGARGLGKTWLAMHIARQIAEGGKVGPWKVDRPRRVLYVDGEMPLDAILQRDTALAGGTTSKMLYLQHEALFHLRANS